ncbi:MAG: hypothetical protein VYD54_09755 [Bdellovibrionota bacterium]|nr:hypothetical protein [Bdellovibrionota bacterium]
MHYRLTKLKFIPEYYDQLFTAMDNQKVEMMAIPGVQWIDSIQISKDELMVFAQYEKKEQAEAALPKVAELLGNIKQFLAAPPERVNGDVVWTSRS